MQIVPVIDIKGGLVVHAKPGGRSKYLPLCTEKFQQADPSSVVSQMSAEFQFDILYVADLDAIEGRKANSDAVLKICRMLPDKTIWLDAGFRRCRDIDIWQKEANVLPAVASESWEEPLKFHTWPDFVLSLDFREHKLLHTVSQSQEQLLCPAHWPLATIMLSLDQVGSKAGPNPRHLEYIQSIHRQQIFIGGGVRSQQDLLTIQQSGASGALLGTALYQGHITPDEISEIIAASVHIRTCPYKD